MVRVDDHLFEWTILKTTIDDGCTVDGVHRGGRNVNSHGCAWVAPATMQTMMVCLGVLKRLKELKYRPSYRVAHTKGPSRMGVEEGGRICA